MINHEGGTDVFRSQNMVLTSTSFNGQDCLKFLFKGHFTKEVCSDTSEAWIREFERKKQQSFVMIWDCLEMSDFDYDAKNEWTKTLSNLADQITQIYVLSNSIVIRGAARLMGKFSKYDLKVVKSYDEID